MSFKLTFDHFVSIAAETQDKGAEEVEGTISRSKAEAALSSPFGGPDEFVLYSDPVERAALCCAAVIRERPLPHDNKRVAYKCMEEMLVRYPWAQFEADRNEIESKLDDLDAGTIDTDQFVFWVRAEAGLAVWLRYQLRPTA
jgi:prophage maintenance system killer protein